MPGLIAQEYLCPRGKRMHKLLTVTKSQCRSHSHKHKLLGLARTVYIHTVYDRIFGGFAANIPYIHSKYMVLANPTHYLLHVVSRSCVSGVAERLQRTEWKFSFKSARYTGTQTDTFLHLFAPVSAVNYKSLVNKCKQTHTC